MRQSACNALPHEELTDSKMSTQNATPSRCPGDDVLVSMQTQRGANLLIWRQTESITREIKKLKVTIGASCDSLCQFTNCNEKYTSELQ